MSLEIFEHYMPDHQEWAESRNYIAVVKHEHDYFEYQDPNEGCEPLMAFDPVILYFYNFTGAYADPDGKTILSFRENGITTEAYVEDVDFYKLDKPKVINSVENITKQNLT
jgi:hypothetical protein